MASELHFNLGNVGFDLHIDDDKLVVVTIMSVRRRSLRDVHVSLCCKTPDSPERDVSRWVRVLRSP